MPRPPRFTIRAASALTGINQNTLRAWERRHGLIRPERTPKGYRLYSDRDIERLRLIQHVLQGGASIGKVRAYLETNGTGARPQASPAPSSEAAARVTRVVEVSLAGAGLKGTTTIRVPADEPVHGVDPTFAALSRDMAQTALRLDRPALERAFARTVGLYSLRHAFHALAPSVTRMDGYPVGGESNDEAVRFLTAFAREKLLGALAGLRPLHQQPRALFACLPGEQQEMELILLSLEVGLEGVSALYMGADTPIEAVHQAAKAAGSRAAALSATSTIPRESVLELRDRLASLPRRPRLLVGGSAAWRSRGWLLTHDIEVLSSVPDQAGAQVLRAIGRD